MNDKLKLGIIGLGSRGNSMTRLLAERDDCVISAVCDLYDDRVESMQNYLAGKCGLRPLGFSDFTELTASSQVDVVFVFSAWENHIPAAVEAMRCGKPVAFEVGGAYSIEDCFRLVSVYEETRVPVMMLENCCYGRIEMTLTEMQRSGVFGELIHCAGGYLHDLRSEVATGKEARHYRLRNYLSRNCENYPTHELGPIARLLDIGHGNRFTALSSFSSRAAGINAYAAANPKIDPALRDAAFSQGDVVNTILRTERGQTVLLTLDTTLPRPYSRGLTLHGTHGFFEEDNMSVCLDGEHTEADHMRWKNFWNNYGKYESTYMPALWREYLNAGVRKGHGGMDFLVLDAFITSLTDGQPMPLDVYDTAMLMAVTPLSAASIAAGGSPVDFPDLTHGLYLQSRPVNGGKYALWR